MKQSITESDLENFVLNILADLGFEIIHGNEEQYLPGGSDALREDYKNVLLVERLKNALHRINPHVGANDYLPQQTPAQRKSEPPL